MHPRRFWAKSVGVVMMTIGVPAYAFGEPAGAAWISFLIGVGGGCVIAFAREHFDSEDSQFLREHGISDE